MSAVVIAIVALPAVSLLLAGLTRMESLLTVGLDEPTVTGSAMPASTMPGSTMPGIDDVGALAA